MFKLSVRLSVFFVFCMPSLFAQTISGKVENMAGEKIENAQVLLKDSVSAFQIKEFAFANKGIYNIQPKQKYVQLVLEVNAMGYKKEYFIIPDFQPTQTYQHDFVLEIETTTLEEVVVSEPSRYVQNGDTTSFKVEAYRDGTERKIEDLIKKLPNVEVNDRTGAIKYKGKPIETVRLDGDDLFDNNYAIGTRNIDVNMVEQVQALENYSDNPLLKGVENGDKVALNLVLKKLPTKYSGNAEVGLGLFLPAHIARATDISGSLLGISNRYKSFATLSHNNVGINKTPYDYAGYNVQEDMMRNPTMFAPRYIPDTYFSIGIDSRRNNFNNAVFASYNAITKIKRLTIKFNLLYLHDKITSEQFSQNDFSFNNEAFITTDQYSIRKIPNRYIGKLDLKYNLSKKMLLEYNGSYDFESVNTHTSVLQNNTTSYQTNLSSKAYLLRQVLTYTYRFLPTMAVQFLATHISHQTPQDYGFLPAIYAPQTFLSNNQTSIFKKQYIEAKAQLLGKKEKENVYVPDKDKNKYELALVGIYQASNFNTDLWGHTPQERQNIASFTNRGKYERYVAYLIGSYKWIFKNKWSLQPSAKITSLKQFVQDFVSVQNYEAYNFVFEPALSVRYKVGKTSSISTSAGYKQNPFSEDHFVQNPVYMSNRSISGNEISLRLQQNQFFNLGYSIGDLSRFFKFSLMGMYSQNKGNYFNRLNIQNNSTSTVSIFLPESTQSKTVAMMTEKYIHTLKSTFRLRSNYTLSDYKNLIGNLTLRNNQSTNWSNELFFKTAFDIKVNFENVVRYNVSASKTENGERFMNKSLSNTLQIVIKPTEKLFLILSQDYFLQDIQQPKNAYYFADISCRYTTSKLTWQFYLKNTTNTQTFQQVFVNDYANTVSQTNLLPRHFLISTYFSF